MAWDKSLPRGTKKIRLSDDDIRANNSALEIALSEGHDFSTGGTQTGKHTTPTFVDNGATPAQPTGVNEIALANNGTQFYTVDVNGITVNLHNKYTQAEADSKFAQVANNLSDVSNVATAVNNLGALDASENLAELTNLSTARSNLSLGSAAIQNDARYAHVANNLSDLNDIVSARSRMGGVPPTTKMLFKQSAAPAGWTFAAEDNDRALLNTNVEADGGTIGGSWQQDGHVLSQAEMPSHNHGGVGSTSTDGNHSHSIHRKDVAGANYYALQLCSDWLSWASSTSANGSHNHSFTVPTNGSDYAHDHGAAWRPAYIKCITATKD